MLLSLLQHPPLPLPSFIPTKNIPKLTHQIRLAEVIPRFTDKPRSIDEFLREEVHELEEFVVGIAVP
jgi:hypothetical protein